MIPNCPVTKGNILNAKDIFRKNVRVLQGKTTRKKMPCVTTAYKDLPTGMLERHGQVTRHNVHQRSPICHHNITQHTLLYSRTHKKEKAATIAASIKQVLHKKRVHNKTHT